jgi:hypothetical protein
MAAISDELVVEVGASGEVDLTAPLIVTTAANATAWGEASLEVYGRWQWWDGAAWQDLGASETASDPDCRVILDAESSTYSTRQGAMNVSASKTGLTPAATEKFRLQARNITAAVSMNYSGTATASTS